MEYNEPGADNQFKPGTYSRSAGMEQNSLFSVMRGTKKKAAVEAAAQAIFTFCGFLAVLAVGVIVAYMIASGTPALARAGWKEILFGTVWRPGGEEPRYGIFYCILSSLAGTLLAVLIGAPVGVLTAVFLAELADKRLAGILRAAVELLAGIPSVIYGLLGIYLLNPMMYRLERWIFAGSETHQFTGGANLLSASLILAVMILPTVVNISEAAIRAVDPGIRRASLALGEIGRAHV